MRGFVGIDLGREPVPDETTVCRFRHLLEEHDLGRPLFDEVQRHLAALGLKVASGTIVDATIINAPSSTKNADKARDPEMHQTKKGNQWYFGMKAHFGVDSRTKLIHAAVATPAKRAISVSFAWRVFSFGNVASPEVALWCALDEALLSRVFGFRVWGWLPH